MPSFMGNNMELIINAVPITCLTNVDTDQSKATATVECADNPDNEQLVGTKSSSLNFQAVVKDDDAVYLNGLIDLDGALTFRPTGVSPGDLELASTRGQVSQITTGLSVNGFMPMTGAVMMDNGTWADQV